MKKVLFLLAFLSQAGVALATDTLVVKTYDTKPEVFRENGRLIGFEVELMDSIAAILNYHVQYEPIDNFLDIFSTVAKGQADAGISGITICAAREDSLDFTHTTQRSGLLIAVPNDAEKPPIVPIVIRKLFSLEMLLMVAYLIITILLLSLFMFFAERGENGFPKTFWHDDPQQNGFYVSLRMTWEYMSTIGSGFRTPITKIGYALGFIGYLATFAMMGFVVGPIVSAFTVRDIETLRSEIKGPADLRGKAVATMAGTTTVPTLEKLGAYIVATPTIEEAYAKLFNKEVAAVVFDAPVIQYFVKTEGAGKAAIVGEIFDVQYYGIVLAQGSRFREPINRALLKLEESGSYHALHQKWFGCSE